MREKTIPIKIASMTYRIVQKQWIEELQIELTEMQHIGSGAQILHLGNQDAENVFCLSFRTIPPSSNGIAHILEHTVLCGSKRYPGRDPFFGMARRSLNTFMNAFTGTDFTCYPAASEIPKDFYHLLEVYLDAVFFPLLTKESFLQEGHRLEFQEIDVPSSPLQYKGIVFNEMKGALASGEARLSECLMHHLFPDTPYGYNSGGDPKEIPKLSHEELRAFHKQFYHPSNCLFFFYGNLPLEQHLACLENRVFPFFSYQTPPEPIRHQPRFAHPKKIQDSYPLGDDEQPQHLVGFGWLTCSLHEKQDVLILSVLDMILMGTDAGLLKKELLATQLCHTVDSTLDDDLVDVPYFLICKGCRADAAVGLEYVVRQTLENLSSAPFPPEVVEGAMHQLEMARTEITGNSTPYGLSLFFRAGLLQQQGGRIEDGLRVHSLFTELRQQLADPLFLPNKIRQFFLDCPHHIQVELIPDSKLNQAEWEAEQSALEELRKALSPEQAQHIVEEATQLIEQQEETDNRSLPSLKLEDVPIQGKQYPIEEEHYKGISIRHHDVFTNGHVYVDLLFSVPDFPIEWLPFIRLFVWMAPQLGCAGRSYEDHLNFVLQHIGAFGCSLDLYPQSQDPNALKPTLAIRGKCLSRKMPELFSLIRDALGSVDVHDIPRIRDLLRHHLYETRMAIQQQSLRYAVHLGSAACTYGGALAEQCHGLHYFWWLEHITREFETNPHPLIEKLGSISQYWYRLAPHTLVLSCSRHDYHALRHQRFYDLFEQAIPQTTLWIYPKERLPVISHGRLISSPVASSALIFPSIPYQDPRSAALSIAAEVMTHTTLHPEIREQGGAYGAGATHSAQSGIFYLYSYRDPHLTSTYDSFRRSITRVIEGRVTEEELLEAKFSLFQDLDSPVAPGSRGMISTARLLSGKTDQDRQRYRDAIRATDIASLAQSVADILPPDQGIWIPFANPEFFAQHACNLPLEKISQF